MSIESACGAVTSNGSRPATVPEYSLSASVAVATALPTDVLSASPDALTRTAAVAADTGDHVAVSVTSTGSLLVPSVSLYVAFAVSCTEVPSGKEASWEQGGASQPDAAVTATDI